jgi:hypothetical protein
MFVFLVSRSLCDDCYLFFEKNGTITCPVCRSRTGDICGYCLEIGQCGTGTKEGSESIQCDPDIWIYPKDTCTNEMCQKAKAEIFCLNPCLWNSKYSECILPRDFSRNTNKENFIEAEESLTNRLIIAFIVIIIVGAVGIYLYIAIFLKEQPYNKIQDAQDSTLPLDALPYAVQYNDSSE